MIDIAYTSSAEGKRIADLSPLAGLTQLETLILKQNGIDDISPLSGLSNLTTFDVSANQLIEDISSVAGMTSLKSLNASFNKVNSIDALSNLENLEYVAISNNNITSLPDLSKLTKVYFLDISHNQLTDVSEIAKMKNLEQLNLSGNTGITDITPLVSLLKLDKNATTLPDESKKDDLFAAIEVNKLFNLFNISKMREMDIENVENALLAFNTLTEVQKTYFDPARIEAARSNLEKVKNGMEPDYYPEYDVEGEKVPVFNAIEIKVVDKKGVPLAGVSFDKISKNGYSESTSKVTTNSVGSFVLKHTSMDPIYDEIIVKPSGDEYVSDPEFITYTVAWGNKTATVNGQPATGLEELVFTLVSVNEFVDKSELEAAIAKSNDVEREAKYTKDSYQAYLNALSQAQTCFENVDATEEEVAAAAEALERAIKGLEKTDVLTELKLIVKDINGNVFHREFKFQVRIPVTKKEAYNVYSEPSSGALYMQTLPTWPEGKEWEILACNDEAYQMTPVTVTIGVTSDGQRYFKTVDGKSVGVDFEKEIVVTHIPELAASKRQPDSQVLEAVLAEAKEIDTAEYTTTTVDKLIKAITNAESVLEKTTVIQEDYNAAIAAIENAERGLIKAADKKALQEELDRQYYYSADSYTEESWEKYENVLWNVECVFADGNATQQEVDEALETIKQAAKELVARANKTQLGTLLADAKALDENDYQSGFEALEYAVREAEAIYNNTNATQDEVNAQVQALQDAMDALVKKPAEVNYACDPGVFRAKVTDAKGKPVAGVVFESVIDGQTEANKLVSDANGIITYYVYGQNRGKTTYIRLADKNYVTSDEHYFTADGINNWVVSMTAIDGKTYADGTKLTYIVKPAGEGEDPSEKVLCDVNTFRAKVADEDGEPVTGLEFSLIPGASDATAKTVTTTSKGIIEYVTDAENDSMMTYTLKLAGSKYESDPVSMSFTTGEGAVIQTVNGTVLSEITEELVFTVRKVQGPGGETPETVNKKALDDEIFFAKSYEGKASDYTADSYKAFEDALAEAKKVYNDEAATQDQVDKAAKDLKAARTDLVAVEKPAVCDKSTIRIQVVDEDGNLIKDAIPFKVGTSTQYSRKGIIEYVVSAADSGLSEMVVALRDGEVVLGEKTFVAEPEQYVFTLEEYAGDVYITAINGETLDRTKEVRFVLKEEKQNVEPENPDDPDDPDEPVQPEVKPFDGKVTLSVTKYVYNGKVRRPDVTVKDADGNKLAAGTDYEVTYAAGRKNVGRYKVTVTFKGSYTGSKNVYFTIVPKAPASASANLSTASGGYNDVKFTWKASTGAKGYLVYYKKASAAKWSGPVAVTGKTSYTKKNLTDGVKYSFKVVPYYKTSSGTTKYYSAEQYKTASVYTLKKVAAPALQKVSGKVKVKWKNINGETGYQISKSTKKSGTNIVATYKTTTGTYKLLNATKGKTYYYKVRAYKTVDGKNVYGPWSTVKSMKR